MCLNCDNVDLSLGPDKQNGDVHLCLKELLPETNPDASTTNIAAPTKFAINVRPVVTFLSFKLVGHLYIAQPLSSFKYSTSLVLPVPRHSDCIYRYT